MHWYHSFDLYAFHATIAEQVAAYVDTQSCIASSLLVYPRLAQSLFPPHT